jgi:small subunit ribosomal protein S6
LNEYELLYIVHPRRAQDEVPAVIEWVSDLVTQGGGEVLTVDDWGRRRLAYPISHEMEGTYVLTTLRLSPEAPRAIESQMVISEDIMRHMLIRGIMPLERGEAPAEAVQERVEPPREMAPPLAQQPAEASAEASDEQADAEPQASDAESQATDAEPQDDGADAGGDEAAGEQDEVASEPSPATAGAD